MPLDPAPANPWRTVSSTEVYRNRWSVLREDRLADADGRPGLYAYFAPRDAVMVLPLHPDGSVTLVRQWRYVYGCSSWEVPCGAVEPGETGAVAARRELAEEVGLAARRWRHLGLSHPSDARVGGLIHCWLAEDLVPADGHAEDTECDLVCERVPFAEALAAVRSGRITHVASQYLILRAALEIAPDAPGAAAVAPAGL